MTRCPENQGLRLQVVTAGKIGWKQSGKSETAQRAPEQPRVGASASLRFCGSIEGSWSREITGKRFAFRPSWVKFPRNRLGVPFSQGTETLNHKVRILTASSLTHWHRLPQK